MTDKTQAGEPERRPVDCRFRLADEGKPYPRSSCIACGRTVIRGLGKQCHIDQEANADLLAASQAEVERLTDERDELALVAAEWKMKHMAIEAEVKAYQAQEPIGWEWQQSDGAWVRGGNAEQRKMHEYDNRAIREIYAAPVAQPAPASDVVTVPNRLVENLAASQAEVERLTKFRDDLVIQAAERAEEHCRLYEEFKRLTAEIKAYQAQEPVVKALEWGPYPNPVLAGPDVAVAHIEFNHFYQAQRNPDAPGFIVFLAPKLGTLWWESKGHNNIEQAKAAAQADYEQRIRSAL